MSDYMIFISVVIAFLFIIFLIYSKRSASVSFHQDKKPMLPQQNHPRNRYGNEVHLQYVFTDTEFQNLIQSMLGNSEVSLGDRKITIPDNAKVFIEYEHEYQRSEIEIKVRWENVGLQQAQEKTSVF